MIPFFIILGLFFLFHLIIILFYLSTLEIEVKNINYDSLQKENNFLIFVRLKLLNKLTWAKIKIDNKGMEKYKEINKKLLSKITIDLRKEILESKNLIKIEKLDFVLKKINLKIELNLFEPMLTALTCGIISTVLSIIFAKKIEEYTKEKCNYKIEPIFSNNPQLKLCLNCIISIKMVHIINTVYMLFKKGSEKDGKQASNRRTYAYRNV